MPWLKIDDRISMSMKIRGLADDGATGERAKQQRNAALGHWLQILAWCASERTDGFVTTDVLLGYGTRSTTQRLLRSRYGRAPLIHHRASAGPAPTCPCLDGRRWPPDFDYAIHDYLDYNPSRSENDVHRAKKRELRDATLKRAVRDRDHDRCRYCGKWCQFSDRVSDDGLTFDHVDPEIANGLDNLVVACRGCNNKKGRRTPHEADMRLLSEPETTASTSNGPVTGPATVVGPVTGPVTGRRASPPQHLHQVADAERNRACPGRDGPGPRPNSREDQAVPSTAPVGQIGPPTTARGSRSTSPYARSPRPSPDNHAGHPGPTTRRSP
jgi:5-methylcytosine-specific restriction endonuclease McrA